MNCSSPLNFKPRQIVCLEHQSTCLYSEVIQVVTSRQLCWVRPLCLAALPDEISEPEQENQLFDLRLAADLLWPASWFRPALDTEVIPLIRQMQSPYFQSEDVQKARQQLNHFVNQVWQARQFTSQDS